jgi:DNA-directed RNA polymerase specialized sigma24 family protein
MEAFKGQLDRATAEDLTSEVFVQMVEGISHLRASDETGVASWMLQITRVTVAGYYPSASDSQRLSPLNPGFWEEETSGETYCCVPHR